MSKIAPFPHHYVVQSECAPQNVVILSSEGLAEQTTMPPPEFGGPGDQWSPETLLTGALASCFALTFKAIARHKGLEWVELKCRVDGELIRERGNSWFSQFHVRAHLVANVDEKDALAEEVMRKSKESCLISNSLSGKVHLEFTIVRPIPSHTLNPAD
ncbi:MAG: OsmC family protein [Xanthomonadales bacterium]|nr:OsmC family protein [Xanthomonadales bacterium]